MYGTHYFMLETYVDVPGKPQILRVETNNEYVEMPPFVSIQRDVTKDREYSSAVLA